MKLEGTAKQPTDEGLYETTCCSSFSPRNLHLARKVVGGEILMRMVSDDGAQVDNLTDAEVVEVQDALSGSGLRVFRHNDRSEASRPVSAASKVKGTTYE